MPPTLAPPSYPATKTTFTLTVESVNDAPEATIINRLTGVMELNGALTDNLGDAADTALGVYLSVDNLKTVDVDDTPADTIYTLVGRGA